MKRKQRQACAKGFWQTIERQFRSFKTLICWLALAHQVVSPDIFENLPLHGNTSWLPVHLVTLAILWVWSDQANLTTAFSNARQTALTFCDNLTLASYHGFHRSTRYLERILYDHCSGRGCTCSWNSAAANIGGSVSSWRWMARIHFRAAYQEQ